MTPTPDGVNAGDRRAGPGRPCPVCRSGSKGCSAADDGLIRCRGAAGPAAGFAHLGPAAADPQWHLYRPAGGGPRPRRPPDPAPAGNWRTVAEGYARGFTPDARDQLAAALGLPTAVFDALPLIGHSGDADRPFWTFPEADATGAVVGINRRFADGRKLHLKGGKRGLTLAGGWPDRPGPLLLVEGPTDTLALVAAGLAAVGRPSNTGGVAQLAALLVDDPAERPVLVVGENDRKPDGSWPGRDGAVRTAAELTRRLRRPVRWTLPPAGAKDVRAWLTDPVRAATAWPDRGIELLRHLTETAADPTGADDTSAPGDGPVITVGPDEGRVNDQATAALARADGVYQRGGLLVHVLDRPPGEEPVDGGRKPADGVALRDLAPPLLRDRLTRCARWEKAVGSGEGERTVPAHPPAWCVTAVHARGDWPGVPRLEAVVTHPVLLPDGTVLAASGYHRPSGLLVALPPTLTVGVPDRPTAADVTAAVETLLDAVAEFPFETPATRAAWAAGLLTPLAWWAFDGPAPLTLIDANVRAAGKGLLADVVALTLLGRRFPVMAYTPDREELRKRITALVIEGERLVLLDNLAGPVGNDVLDAALTSDRWKDRVLGASRVYDGPLHACWFATGNNVQLQADTARRVSHVRIERPDERPELKADFRRPDLRAFVRASRGRLLAAALTVLRGWVVAGRPAGRLPAWGSYEGWSGVVRAAVVWAGLPDPGDTRVHLLAGADRDAAAMEGLLGRLRELDPDRRGLSAPDLVERAKTDADLKSAIDDLAGRQDGRALGYRLRSFRRRLFGGWFLDHAAVTRGGARWAAFPAAQFHQHRPGAGRTPPAAAGGDGGDGGDGSGRPAGGADPVTTWANDDSGGKW